MASWLLEKNISTVEIVYNETDYNEQPEITIRFGAEVRSRRCTYMIIAISVITRTGFNEQIRLDLGASYIRFLRYYCFNKKMPRNVLIPSFKKNGYAVFEN